VILPGEIRGICVTLLIADKQTLVVMMDESGGVNRAGTGSTENTDWDLYIGKTDPASFQRLRSKVSPQLLNWCGQARTAPEVLGKPCKLKIDFFADLSERGKSSSMVWNYGSESQGPPPDVCEFVLAAIDVSREWHERQKKSAFNAGTGEPKRWWQFWRP
jgi:hypothetical protein